MSIPTVLQADLKFHPRPYQLKIITALNSGIKRAVWVCHRRAGKDLTVFNWCIYKLLQETAICYYILPTYSQAKKVIWDSITIDGQRILDYIPSEVIASKHKQEMKIELINGSVMQMIGSDNIDSIVGTNPKIIVFSEYAIQTPQAWDYLRPILKVNGGYAIFQSTPRGKNHFYDLYNMAKHDKDWFCELLNIDDTKVLTQADLDDERKQGMSDEMIQQEYMCSFSRGVDGTYYGRLIEKAYQEGRICRVPYETRGVVNTAFDLGFGDATSIVFWQDIAGECRIIDFMESQGEPIANYARRIKEKPYNYGTHYLPHDGGNKSLESGRCMQDVLHELGIRTTVLEREKSLKEGIGVEAVRSLLSICFIDSDKCGHLLKCLENYHKRYLEKQNTYSEMPEHDWTSHAADSVRYMAMARQQFGRGPGSLTPDKIKEMRQRHGLKG